MEDKIILRTSEDWFNIARLECLCNVSEGKKSYARSIDIASILGYKTSTVNHHLGKLVKEGKLRKEFCRWWTEYYLV